MNPPEEKVAEEGKSKLSPEDHAKGHHLIGRAQECDETIKMTLSWAAKAEKEYTELRDSAVTAGDVMRAQEAKDKWRKLEADIEEQKKIALESRAEARRILGDEYPAYADGP